ncbi:6-phosphofructokinase [bacterium]|jgi:6-phosphofructokinase 1|nr:6-phosphofructokinase [bacterium]
MMTENKGKIRKIAVLTSGGDSPGMNPAIRAVVRTAMYNKIEVLGIKNGYDGLINDWTVPLTSRSVGGIINRGGTILFSARSEKFKTPEGRQQAFKTLKNHNVSGLVAIGGDGTYRGAHEFHKETGFSVIGVPGTIDNDIAGTDYTIGFYTAIDTAMQAIDKIRDTAISHNRLFLVEVMGRHAGFIAVASAIAGGAEDVLIPETKTDIKDLCKRLNEGRKRGKISSIIVVAEGDEEGNAMEIAKKIEKDEEYETRVSVIGYQQRGGSPSALDRILATRLGSSAVEELLKGTQSAMVGIHQNKVVTHPLEMAWKEKKPINEDIIKLVEIMSS